MSFGLESGGGEGMLDCVGEVDVCGVAVGLERGGDGEDNDDSWVWMEIICC